MTIAAFFCVGDSLFASRDLPVAILQSTPSRSINLAGALA
jgi:hypothetical protein